MSGKEMFLRNPKDEMSKSIMDKDPRSYKAITLDRLKISRNMDLPQASMDINNRASKIEDTAATNDIAHKI